MPGRAPQIQLARKIDLRASLLKVADLADEERVVRAEFDDLTRDGHPFQPDELHTCLFPHLAMCGCVERLLCVPAAARWDPESSVLWMFMLDEEKLSIPNDEDAHAFDSAHTSHAIARSPLVAEPMVHRAPRDRFAATRPRQSGLCLQRRRQTSDVICPPSVGGTNSLAHGLVRVQVPRRGDERQPDQHPARHQEAD